MKGQIEKEKLKRIPSHSVRLSKPERKMPLYLTPLDLFPLHPTKENVYKYLIDSYWIEAQAIKIMGLEHPILDDTIQEIYLIIYDKMDKLLEVYEDRGILAFCGYIKAIVSTQARFTINIQKKLFGKLPTIGMSKEMEVAIDEQFDYENEDFYKLKGNINYEDD